MNHLDGKLYVGSERRDTFRDAGCRPYEPYVVLDGMKSMHVAVGWEACISGVQLVCCITIPSFLSPVERDPELMVGPKSAMSCHQPALTLSGSVNVQQFGLGSCSTNFHKLRL